MGRCRSPTAFVISTLHALQCCMRKTSVYLTDEEAEALQRAARVTGRSQAELIRDGIRYVVSAASTETRRFHSMGMGHGGGQAYESWNADSLYREVVHPEP
jgi:dienelactone hydrolase